MNYAISISLLFFLILRIFSNPIANVFQKKLAENNSSLVINLYCYFVLSFVCVPFSHSLFHSGYSINLWFWALLAGFLCALGTVCLIKAVSLGELSVIGPINSYKSVIGLISAFIFLKEVPTLFGFIGMALILFGSRFILTSVNDKFSFDVLKRKDIQLRFCSLLLTGTEAAILKKIIILSNVQHCFMLWCFTGLLWSFIFFLFMKREFKKPSVSLINGVLMIALCLGAMQYSTNFVFERIPVGLSLALFQLSSIVTVFLGYKYFKEKDFSRKLTGTIIMLIGSVIIILF